MQPVFSTDNLHPKSSFKIWRETLFERLVPIEIERLDDSPFAGKMEFANVGTLRMTRVTQGALRNETTPNAARHHDRADREDLPLTHELLSLMLGVRRAGVTDALGKLVAAGYISTSRGQITIIDRAGLEDRAGDSYGVPEANYRMLVEG